MGRKAIFYTEVLEATVGEEAGFKSVTLKNRKIAYGKLKQEIRYSPLCKFLPLIEKKRILLLGLFMFIQRNLA